MRLLSEGAYFQVGPYCRRGQPSWYNPTSGGAYFLDEKSAKSNQASEWVSTSTDKEMIRSNFYSKFHLNTNVFWSCKKIALCVEIGSSGWGE